MGIFVYIWAQFVIPFLFSCRLEPISYCLYVSPYLPFFTVWSGLAPDRKPQDSSFTGKKKSLSVGEGEIIGTSQHNTTR